LSRDVSRREVDVLVIGAGLAGLAVALSLPRRRVTVLCSWMPPGGTATAMAQGGIAAAVSADDSAGLHAEDTMRAGAGACDAEAVRVLCHESVPAIEWLEHHGVRFDHVNGHRALHREAAHSRPRVLHVDQDRTGFGITRALVRAARAAPQIDFLSGHHAVALTRSPRGVDGVIALDRAGAVWRIDAAETVLATGGLGQLFSCTTNPRNACGDGLALALAAGAQCRSLEFVQFHPTALDVPADPMPLLTEALRGAGARLIDAEGTEFMRGVHPDADLAPRHVVAREVWQRVMAGERIFLDAREIFARQSGVFPSVRTLCARHHVDPAGEPVPVAPAAHYHMGGVAVDLDGRSSLAHLWACGEVACTGAHGANRLASNSLLEAVVFGRRLARKLSEAETSPRTSPVDGDAAAFAGASLEVDGELWRQLRSVMWRHAGIVRDGPGLVSAREQLCAIDAAVPPAQVALKGRVRVASAIVDAALARKASLGAHVRSDV
jgi:L-aspartate oxidase